MPRFKPKGMLERSALDDLWKHTLSRIPTVFGRLSYLTSLRDGNSGVYRHHGLIAAFGREDSLRALKESHERTFAEWLGLSMAAKHEDLMEYVATLEDPKEVVIDHWVRSKVYRMQVPGSAPEMERDLFFSDLDALLETVRNGLADGEPGRASSPPR